MGSVRDNRKKVIAFALIIGVCVIIGSVLIAKGYLTIDWVNAQFDTLTEILNRSYGPVLYILGTIAFILLQIPGVVPVILAPLVYSFWEAFLLTMIGVNIGMIATFLVARYFLRDYFAPKLEGSRLGRFTKHIENNGIMTMTFLRVILWMFPPMNWMIGATNIKIRDYIIGNLIGLAPIIFAIQLATKRVQSIDSFWDVLQPETIGVIFAIIVILIAIIWIRRKYFSPSESQFNGGG